MFVKYCKIFQKLFHNGYIASCSETLHWPLCWPIVFDLCARVCVWPWWSSITVTEELIVNAVQWCLLISLTGQPHKDPIVSECVAC